MLVASLRSTKKNNYPTCCVCAVYIDFELDLYNIQAD